MEINIINQSHESKWTRYKNDFITISKTCEIVLNLSKERCASVIFVTPAIIHEINMEYRGIDRSTDVISFALNDSEDGYQMMDGVNELGDIFINVEAILQQAKEYGHSQRREVCFLFTHGLLHLLGYDHIEKDEERIMFALQDEILHDIVPKKIPS